MNFPLYKLSRYNKRAYIEADTLYKMLAGSSLRLTMVNFGCIARQTRAFVTPVRNYFPRARTTAHTALQTPANSVFMLCNGRTLHTSVRTNTEKSRKGTTAQEESENELTLKDRLKIVVQEYGATAIVFHVSISLTSLGICYAAVKSGIDVHAALQKIGVSPKVSDSTVATEASTFVVAYACHKVFAPLRMLMTITCTPLIVRKLRRMGFMKEPVKQ